jgi:uncharacterized membrane protein YhhN
MNTLVLPAALSCISVIALVLSDYYQRRAGRYLFKPLAALSFVWLAIALNATDTSYGSWLLAGLVCCLVGDLLLMFDNDQSFLAGLAAFLCGHLLYAVAFLHLPGNLTGLIISSLPALLLLTATTRWLAPNLDQKMRKPVMLYIAVITFMLLCTGLSAGHPAAGLIIAGAWGFAASDLAVARQQFVCPSRVNKLWGTPLYFLSQMLLAGSVGI